MCLTASSQPMPESARELVSTWSPATSPLLPGSPAPAACRSARPLTEYVSGSSWSRCPRSRLRSAPVRSPFKPPPRSATCTSGGVGGLSSRARAQGALPSGQGVKPHLNLTMTLEGLKGELGAPPAELDLSLPISVRTAERLACDCTMSRVLLADSMVIDVGRETRTVSAPRMRALRVRDKGCRVPGCDRQVNWSNPHHIVYRPRGRPDNLENLVLLCYYHHRQVHEGGWQVVKVGREFQFLPPERVVMRRARGPGYRWAA